MPESPVVAEAFQHAVVGMALVGDDDRVVAANAALVELLGHDPTGSALDDVLLRGRRGDDDREGGLLRRTGPGAATRSVEVRLTPLAPSERDATTLVQVRDVPGPGGGPGSRLGHDRLTGLLDREGFLAAAGAHLAERGAALLYLDLDRFRLVNDSLGHAAGDQLLQEFARRLAAEVRPDDVVARLGADEFAVLQPGVEDEQGAVAVAERLRAGLRSPTSVAGAEVHLQAGIGVAVGRAGDDPARLLALADVTLHEAKAHGSSGVVTGSRRSIGDAQRLLTLESQLRRALSDGDIRVALQPLWRLEDRRVVGFEALARWTLPDGTTVEPERFVALAGELGLTAELDLIVATRSAQALAGLREAGVVDAATYVGVNCGPEVLVSRAVRQQVVEAVGRGGIEPSALVVEVTERQLPGEQADLRRGVQRLRESGCRVALDDFGTGHTSIGRMLDLPFDLLKLDRSFLAHVDDARGREALRGIVGLGRSMGATVVAEGIETEQQRAVLHGIDADVGQGWLVAPALSPDAVTDWLRGRSLADRGAASAAGLRGA